MTVTLTFVGTGDAFGSGERYNTCFLVDAPGLRFAIGYCVRSAPALALGNRLLISATRSDTFLTSRVDLPNGP